MKPNTIAMAGGLKAVVGLAKPAGKMIRSKFLISYIAQGDLGHAPDRFKFHTLMHAVLAALVSVPTS
jgi:hypothetical protein